MSGHTLLLHVMRQALDESGIDEVAAAGEFSLPAVKPVLFPGAVYGFAARLSPKELRRLFDEAHARALSRHPDPTKCRPIEGNLYPIYWGKDKQLGARPHQHLKDPMKTRAIRLSTDAALAG